VTDRESHPALDRTLHLIKRELDQLYGASGYHQWDEWAFMRVEEGAVIFIVVSPLEDDAVVNVRCYVVRDLPESGPDVGDYLARLNSDQLFGAFSVDEDGDVCFGYSVLGSSLTPETLLLAIHVVARASSQHAPAIIEQWGGLTSLEKLTSELEARPPGESTPGEDAPN
jgi:hypothetical protein